MPSRRSKPAVRRPAEQPAALRCPALPLVLVGLALLAVGGRLVRIETTRGDELRRRAQRQHTARWTVPAQRGDILDCQGRVLAGSTRRPSVFMDPTLIDDARAAAEAVAPVLGLDVDELERLIIARKDRAFVWVKRNLSPDELAAFNEVRRRRRLRAFVVRYEPRRVYPFGELAAHTIGFVGADQHGLAGVELACDQYLRGQDGRARATVDVRRRPLRAEGEDYQPPVDGASVVLTIDTHIQQRTELHLREAFEQHRPQWAVAVVIDPRSGEVLAMATLPAFDPADPVPDDLDMPVEQWFEQRLRNRAIADAYEPGSIFKPFMAAAALDAGQVDIDEVFRIDGPTHRFGRRIIHDTHAYDRLAVHEIISKSSNIGMGLIGARCGNRRLYEFVRLFGFGDPTGIGLPGEHAGLVQDLARWSGYSTQSVPIGQEIAVTPIQVLAAFGVFCNDGLLMRPRIVRGVIGPDGEPIVDESQPVPVRRVLDADVARRFRLRALVEVVNNGTGKRARLERWQVFGKTGTAQVARTGGGGYIPKAFVGSFVCGAPADEPRVAVLVSLYRPSAGKYYGGTVAAPAAAAIVADVLEYLHVPPDR